MPREKREINFSAAELQSAIVNYCMRSNISLPKTRFSEMNIESTGEEVIGLTLTYNAVEGTSREQNMTFVSAKIAVALIMYCRSLHIPIPKKSAKSLVLNHEDARGGITLKIRTDTQEKK